MTGTILVGVDGSANAGHAVDWAAAEAQLRGSRLLLLHASVIDDPYGERARTLDDSHGEDDGASAPEPGGAHLPVYLEHHRLRLLRAFPDLDVAVDAVRGNPATVLIERSRDAELTVVGARGRSIADRVRLGSVSRHVANHAHCPTVVVRDVPSGVGRAVVVGVDDSEHVHDVLSWGAFEARLRGAKLVVVHAWDVPMGDPYGTWMPSPEMTEGIEKQAHDFVADAVAALGDATAGLDVELRVERGHPVTVTSRLADTAALLVLGTHGRGWFEGVLAGSVTAAALHDAACPVVVVPRAA